MREIKFRAWDKVAKRWMFPYPHGFHILGETNCFQMIEQQLHERDPEQPVLLMLNDVEIVQFTGLLDRDGKEIYEGDVIETPKISPRFWTVEFIGGAFAGVWRLEDGTIDANEDLQWIVYEEHNARVVRNIYESPELKED